MWKIINSPIAITSILILTLVAYSQSKNNRVAGEIREIYNELIAITEDAKDDLEKRKLIEGFLKEAGGQIQDAFDVFNNEEDRKIRAEENRLYFETKNMVEVIQPKVIENARSSKIEKLILYKVKNGSLKHLNKIAHTIEFYEKGKLVYIQDDWGSVKLAPGESKSYSLHGTNYVENFDHVKISIYEISIMDVSE